MKEKNYKKVINRNDNIQNIAAMYILLDHGRVNLLDKEYYDGLLKDIEENGDNNLLMTKKYQKEILDISAKMATLEHDDLYDFIQNEIDLSNKTLEKDDTSPEYEY